MTVPLTILQGDCREVLKTLPDESVNCCVTSPPYYGLRNYGVKGQIGLDETPDEYVVELVAVFREVRRVLKDDGTVFLNLGDSYWSNPGNGRGGYSTLSGAKPHLSGAPRVTAYGKRGKVPANSQEHDCFCQSLCDACRAAYRIGKSHSSRRRVATPSVSSFASSHEHTESPFGHPPTSDLEGRDDHSEVAILDPSPTAVRELARPHGAQASTTPESSAPLRWSRSQASNPADECQLCGRSLLGCAQASADKSVGPSAMHSASPSTLDRETNTHDKDAIADVLSRRMTDIPCDCSYPDSTAAYRHTKLKPKDLVGIPWMVAFALRSDGWYLRSDIIWHKPNPMPESVTDRPTKSHEYIFLLTKSERYCYDSDAIREPASPDLIKQVEEGYNGHAIKDYLASNVQDASATKSRIINGARNRIDKQRGHSRRHDGFNDKWDALTPAEQALLGSNKRSVWTVAPANFRDSHFATFPPDLIRPCIRAGCPAGGTVLDPFGGSGTTGMVALEEGRRAILIELNPDYVKLCDERCRTTIGLGL